MSSRKVKIAHIIKRNGAIVAFDQERITNAIFKAALSVGGRDRELAERLSNQVVKILEECFYPHTYPSVEEIQDIVEKVLIENGHAQTAKAYILYRAERARLREARETQVQISDNVPYKILWQVLTWNVDQKVDTVEGLNKWVVDGTFPQLVQDADREYNSNIAKVADEIYKRKDDIRIIIVAGPSSSGKTTTTIKLHRLLQEKNLDILTLNLDNYFFDLEQHPKDEFGDYDFETPQALDLQLINEHLSNLLQGKTVKVPSYNFKTGKRELQTTEFKLNQNQYLLLDSLHGLYEEMTQSVPKEVKFKLYIETLGQLKDKNGEFTRWADTRMLRRMIRDYRHRSYDPERTVGHWHYVRQSELKHIVPFINTVDYILNTALPYELPVHKKYLFHFFPDIIKKYEGNPQRFDAYIRAKRVYDLLDSIVMLEDDICIPGDSLLREFIGGSVYKY